MSSISSFSGSNSASNNLLNQNLIQMDKLKVYVCPKCSRSYDFYFRNGIFLGRVPLIMQCNHTMCEECIRNTFNKGEVVCASCQQPSKIDDTKTKLKIQDMFPVNLYLLGNIHYAKPNQSDLSRLSLKPSGVSYKNRNKGMMGFVPGAHNEYAQDLLRLTYSGIGAFQEHCCQTTCNKVANLRCFECNEVYCETCSYTVHKAARGLQTHKITPLTSDFLPQLTEKCKTHALYLEFNCNTCNTVVCCYCIVQDHSGHQFYQLSYLNDVDRPNFDELILNSEEKLKRLLVAYQKSSIELNNNCQENVASTTETKIAKYFADMHARLQVIEERLRKDVIEAKTSNATSLNSITTELAINIRNLTGLLTTAKAVLYNTSTDIKLNVKVVIERLENALRLPCYLTGQHQSLESLGFVHGDLLENLEDNFSINVENEDSFRLINEDALPDDYDTTLPEAIALMSIDDINQIIGTPGTPESTVTTIPSLIGPQKFVSPSDVLTSALQPKSEGSTTSSTTIENWVQSAAEETKKSNTVPSFKIEERENITVTHIDSPECFYVQLIRHTKFLYSLARDIEQHVRQFAPVVKSPELNKLYVVKYEAKNVKTAWYRGRVTDIHIGPNGQDQQYYVQFIDYGNSTIVKPNMLREISSSLAKLKPFAVQCKLMNIYPVAPEWDAKTMKLMAQMINGSEVIMVVMNHSEGIYEVDLISMPHGASVRDALIFIGDAVPCIQSSSSLTETAFKSTKPLPKLHKRTERFQKGQSVEVFISHVIDPYNVYVQMADFVHHINHLSDVMASYYNNKTIRTTPGNASKNENIYVPKKDMIVAVRSGEGASSVWHRGTVINKYDGQGMVEIFLVDIGNSVVVSYTNIRKLAERFRNLECQAILVKMVHIQPTNGKSDWDSTATTYLNKYIVSKQKLRMLAYDPSETPPEVLLFEHYTTVDICINAVMIREHVAEATPEGSLEVEWMQEIPALQTEVPYVFDLMHTIQSTKKTKQMEDEDESPNIARTMVNVLAFKTPDLIYVALNNEEDRRKLHEVQLEIQNYYTRYHSTPLLNSKENDPCVVFNKQDTLYYRAVILKAIEANKYEVLLRDTANELIVSKHEIFKLEDQFKMAHEGAIRCHMGEICPAGDANKWTFMANEFLQNLLQKEAAHISISKTGPVDKERKSLPIEMWYSEYKPGAALEPSKTIYHSVNKVLIKNGLALTRRTLLPHTCSSVLPQNIAANMQPGRKGALNKKKDMSSATKKESKYNKTKGKNNFKNTKDKEVFKPITTPQNSAGRQNDIYFSTDAAFLHPGIENIPPPYQLLERPKSAESNPFEVAINKTPLTSISAENSPAHNLTFSNATIPEDVDDWNELIKIHEEAEMKSPPGSESVTDWLPPIPFKENNFYGFATFVDDNAHIYLHDVRYGRGLQEMEEKMKGIFDALPSEPKGTIWVPGQICTVKYFVTNNWYRGKIVQVTDDHIKVFMIDFGNVEECKHEDLRFKVMYTSIPAFANKIQLYKVFPKSNEKWLTSDLDELHKSVVDQKIFVLLKGKVKPDFVTPAIVKVGETTINEYMLRKSTNLAPLRVKQPVVIDTDDVVIEEEFSDDLIELGATAPSLSPNFLPPNTTYMWKVLSKTLENQKVPAGIVNILSFDKFIIEFIDDANTEAKVLFQTISEDIKNQAAKQPVLLDLQIGQACVTQFSEDGEWYRGQVYNLENIKYGAVEIWFVDFGNFESVARERVRAIHPDWLQLPVQQYVSQIYALELSEESFLEEVLNQMSSYCNTIKTIEVISIEPLVVQFYDDIGELSYKDLIERNLINYRK